jgi:hypothetical protein
MAHTFLGHVFADGAAAYHVADSFVGNDLDQKTIHEAWMMGAYRVGCARMIYAI